MAKVILEKTTQKFIDGLAKKDGKPLYKMTPQAARKVLEDLQSSHVDKPAVKMEDLILPCGPNGKVSVRILRPESGNGNKPTIMYFHGGGWILGSKNTHDRLIREIAVGSNANVVFVNFTPAPEAQFPTQIEEAYAATEYVAKHGKELKLSTQMAVVGDSVGGNMATVVALLAAERGGPNIQYQALFYPVTDADFTTASYQKFSDGPWLTKAAMEWFWNAYAPKLTDRKKATASPLKASLSELSKLPPALIIVDENDVLRDEGEAYGHKLMQAGVEVTVVRYLGTHHDFMLLNALADTPAVRSAIQLANDNLQRVFAKEKAMRQKGVA